MSLTPTLTDTQELALIEAVRTAARTHVMPRFRRLPDGAVTAKSAADDLVTIADRESEAALTAAMGGILPGALVVGEEAAETDPDLRRRIAAAASAVILDPVDGTWNFAAGLATFGLILAVTAAGETVFGLLYDPVMDDWVLARRGGGTWYGRPDTALRRLVIPETAPEAIRTYAPVQLFPEPVRPRLVTDLLGFGRFGSLRCSCHEYRMMCLGKARVTLGYLPKPWDHAAGVLALTEAGGFAAYLDGAPYRPGYSGKTLIAAASRAEYDETRARLGWLLEDTNDDA